MRGLLSAEYPSGALSGSVDPRTFVLAPHEPATIQGDLSVTASSSGPLTLTQIAGAELYDAQACNSVLLLPGGYGWRRAFWTGRGGGEITALWRVNARPARSGARGIGVQFRSQGKDFSQVVDVGRLG
jgi:hypothetical protein